MKSRSALSNQIQSSRFEAENYLNKDARKCDILMASKLPRMNVYNLHSRNKNIIDNCKYDVNLATVQLYYLLNA